MVARICSSGSQGLRRIGDRLTDAWAGAGKTSSIVWCHQRTSSSARPDERGPSIRIIWPYDGGCRTGRVLNILCGRAMWPPDRKCRWRWWARRCPEVVVIKKAKLRGVPSFGMICSSVSWGFSNHNGIMVLPKASRSARASSTRWIWIRRFWKSASPEPRRLPVRTRPCPRSALAFKLPLTLAQGACGSTGCGLVVRNGPWVSRIPTCARSTSCVSWKA